MKIKKEKKKLDLSSMSQWELIGLRFHKHKLASFSGILICGLYFISFFADFFSVNQPYEISIKNIYSPPNLPRFNIKRGFYAYSMKQLTDPVTLERYYIEDKEKIIPLAFFVRGYEYKIGGIIPSNLHFFGVDISKISTKTEKDNNLKFLLFGGDKFGRDIFSRLIIGSRISLSIGLISIFLSFFLGVTVGGISGFFGGIVDTIIQRIIEIINAFPKLPLWLALGAALPRTWSNLQIYFGITLILSLIGWTGLARVVRGKILSLREEDYITAVRLLGANNIRIIFKHLIPGFTSHIIVTITMAIPGMILGETSLSFLGLGLKSPTISLGVMLQDCMSMQVVKTYPWLLLPVVFIILIVMSFNFIGDGLRDAADPYHS